MGVKFSLVLVVFMTGLSQIQAVDLVVTKTGRSFWAQNTKTNGLDLTFVLNETGKGTNVPLKQLDFIVRGVERGKKYTDQEIESALKLITDAKAMHGSLLKQLKIVQNEWEAVASLSDMDVDQHIADVVSGVKTNRNSKLAYSDAILDLSMIKYKDFSGVYSSKLDVAISDVQEAYLGINVNRLEARAAALKLDLDEFLQIKSQALAALKKDVPAEEKKRISGALDKARETVFGRGMADVRDAMKADKSVDGYLRNRSILLQLKKEVAVTKDNALAVDRALASLSAAARNALPDYDFSNNGYPLSKKDREVLATTRAYNSTQLLLGTPVDEQCFIIVTEVPKPVKIGGTATIPMELVFSSLPKEGREHTIVVSGLSGNAAAKRNMKLSRLFVREGHANLLCPLDLTAQPQEIAPLRDNDGAYVLVYLASRPVPENKNAGNDAEWKAISLACRIPVAD